MNSPMRINCTATLVNAALQSPLNRLLAAIVSSFISLAATAVDPQPAAAGQAGDVAVKAPLDGKVFVGALGPEGKPKDVEDRFVFENGTFVSKECELRCEYPARPYFVRKVGEKIEFLSETKCPYKDASIVWRGVVEDDTINGIATWTISRWYWTIERKYEFSGKLRQSVAPLARAD